MVADTFSNTLGFLIMGTGNDNNTWGTNANNSDFQVFEDAIANILSESVTGGTLDLSGSPPPAAASQVRHWMISFTGTLASGQTVKVPNLSKGWWVNNQTSGAFALTFKTPSGSASATIPQGGYTYVWCDGSNTINVSPYSSVQAQLGNGSASVPSYSFVNETNSGWYRNGTNDLRLSVNGTDVLRVTASIFNILSPLTLQQAGNTVASGPATTVATHLATWNSTNGSLLADGGVAGACANANTITSSLLAPGAAPLPYVGSQVNDNLHVLNDGTNATRDINATAGRVRDDSDATNLHLVATMFKRLDTSWAAGGASGAPAGSCDTGSKGTSQTWHVFLIGNLAQAPTQYARSSNIATITFAGAHGLGAGSTIRVIGIGSGFDGLFAVASVASTTLTYTNSGSNVGTTAISGATVDCFDVLCSQSYSSPTFPSGWTVKQCLGSIITDGSSNIVAQTQVGDYIRYKSPVLDLDNASPGTSRVIAALPSVPNGVRLHVLLNARYVQSDSVYICSPEDTDLAATLSNITPLGSIGSQSGTTNPGVNQVWFWSDTSKNVSYRSTGHQVSMVVLGYRDPRRRLF